MKNNLKPKIISLLILTLLVFQPFSFVLAEKATSTPASTFAKVVNSSPKTTSKTSTNISPVSKSDKSDKSATSKIKKESVGKATTSAVNQGTTESYNASTAQNSAQKTLQPKTDLSTGALIFDYPIAVPPGRNGVQPDLKLQYNSNNKNNDNIFGYGWSINIPYIERINKTGTDKLYTENYFYSSLDGELVAQDNHKFTPKTESGNFSSYKLFDNSWLVTDKQGTTYKFGSGPETRQDDSENLTHVYKWMLEETRDANDNYIEYEYYKDAGQIYPSKIKYTSNGDTEGIFEVEFLREMRADIITSYIPNFLVTTSSRISEIKVKVNGIWVNKHVFTYASGNNGNRSLLQSVTESGQDKYSNVLELPETTFTYHSMDKKKSWVNDETNWKTDVDFTKGTLIGDINGDGLPDILQAYRSCDIGCNHFKRGAYINNGTNWDYDSSWNPPLGVIFHSRSSRGVDTFFGYNLIDVSGDGLLDLIGSEGSYLNTGSGWSNMNDTWVLPISFVNSSGYDTGVRFTEVNGDGMIDIIQGWQNRYTADFDNKVYINDGSGWNLDTSHWSVLIDLANGTFIGDINGDGLDDIIQYFNQVDPGVSSQNYIGTYLNTGSNWEKITSWEPNSRIAWRNNANIIHEPGRLIDANGDGLADLLKDSQVNTGEDWGANSSLGYNPLDAGSASITPYPDRGYRLADFNGDGLTDVVQSWNGGFGLNQDAKISNDKLSDRMTGVTTSLGAIITINYKSSAELKKGDALFSPDLPVIVQTVNTITTTDPVSNISNITSYSYSGGSYFYDGPLDRKFAGFNKVVETDSAGNTTTTFYHQGNPSMSSGQAFLGEYNDDEWKIGKPYRVEVSDISGNIYSKIINKWDDYDLGNGSKFVKLAQTINSTYDGDATHKDTAILYAYDNTNGNLIQKTESGEVVGSDDGSFTDIGTDNFTTTYTYASNATAHILGLPTDVITVDSGSNKIKENKYYYDTQDLGNVAKGNLTKQENWKNGAEYINTQKTYNDFGLVVKSVDANSNVTNYIYDNFNLYPASVTNALNQTTNLVYDYASGQIKQKTDPNNRIWEYVYDGLGRIISEKQPDLVNPTTLVTKSYYVYTDTPNNVAVRKTEYLDANISVNNYVYFDGLGRKVQEKKQAESGQYITKDYIYNNLGLLQKESLPYFGSDFTKTVPTSTSFLSSTSFLYTNYAYDPLQRIITSTNSLGTTTNTYNDWRFTVTDANGKTKDLSKNAYGNLTQVDEHLSTNSTGSLQANSGPAVTLYAYNYLGNLLKITDALGNIRNFTYDGLGRRLTAEDLHAVGDATFGTYTYTYDDNGNLTQIINPKSQTINYTYDVLNRQLTENYTGHAGTEVTYTYDSGTNGIGRLTGIATNALAQTNAYNAIGGLKREIKVINGTTYATGYDYDRLGNQITITNPDFSIVKYNYNSAGLLESIERKENSDSDFTKVVNNFDYSPTGQPTIIAYQNGITTTNTYDPAQLYRLTRKVATSGGSLHNQDLTYAYDAVGNITQIVDASATDTSKTANYVYDDLDRLISATITKVAGGQNAYTQTFTYDSIGNLLTKSDASGTYIYRGNEGANYANPHAVTGIGETLLTYDNNGNELTKGSDLINTWDYNNRLSQVVAGSNTAVYTYDASGQRIVSTNTSHAVIATTNIPMSSPKLPILRQKTDEISKSSKTPAPGLRVIPSVPIIPIPRTPRTLIPVPDTSIISKPRQEIPISELETLFLVPRTPIN